MKEILDINRNFTKFKKVDLVNSTCIGNWYIQNLVIEYIN